MPRFALTDPAAPAPRDVLGWYDTDLFYYPTLPDGLIPVPDETWERRLDRPQCVADDGTFVDAPEPPPAPVILRMLDALEFRRRLTLAERGAITLAAAQALAAGDPSLQVGLDDLSAARQVDLDDPELGDWLDRMVAAELLTPARRAAVLA